MTVQLIQYLIHTGDEEDTDYLVVKGNNNIRMDKDWPRTVVGTRLVVTENRIGTQSSQLIMKMTLMILISGTDQAEIKYILYHILPF